MRRGGAWVGSWFATMRHCRDRYRHEFKQSLLTPNLLFTTGSTGTISKLIRRLGIRRIENKTTRYAILPPSAITSAKGKATNRP